MNDDARHASEKQNQGADSAKSGSQAGFTGSETELSEIDAPRSGCSLLVWSALAMLAGLTVLVLMFGSAPRNDRGETHPAVGTMLSTLDLQPLTKGGEAVRLEDVEGKVALINYWGVWCGPCRMEFPHLIELEKNLRDQSDFRFLSVSCAPSMSADVEELKERTAEFVIGQGAEFPTYSDIQRQSRIGLLEDTGGSTMFTYPTTVILDRRGVIRGLWTNYHPDDTGNAEQLILKLLKE